MGTQENSLPPWMSIPVTFFAWSSAVLFAVFYFLVGLIFGLIPSLVVPGSNRRFAAWCAELWARSLILFNPVWEVSVSGEKHVERHKAYIIVANHQSLLDTLVVLAGLRTHFKFIAKKELFWVPFVGWHMAMAGYVALERGKHESARQVMEITRNWIQRGVSVLFFPEGTRSPDGRVKGFKGGAFKIAQETGAKILPVVINGTGEALPKNSLMIKKKTRFVLSIEEPFSIDPDDIQGVGKAMAHCRDLMNCRLDEIRSESLI